MTRLTDQYPETARKLRAVLCETALDALDSPDQATSDRAMAAWLDAADDENGDIEVSGSMSENGRPVIVTGEELRS